MLIIRAVSLACDGRFVRDGFIGIAGEGSFQIKELFLELDAKPRLAIVDLPVDFELQAEVVVADLDPGSPNTGASSGASQKPRPSRHDSGTCDEVRSHFLPSAAQRGFPSRYR